MFAKDTYISRRERLMQKINDGVILLLGNSEASSNYPSNTYKFRQDSSFLYFFGHNEPDLAAILDPQSGEQILFGNNVDMDDIIWMGPQPTIAEKGEKVGITHTEPFAALGTYLAQAQKEGRKVHFLPPYRNHNKILLNSLLNIPIPALKEQASLELINAVVDLRIVKEECELEEIHKACDIGYQMHFTAMKMAKLG